MELAILQDAQLSHLLPEVECGLERLGLLEQTVNQFLRPADGQRRDVINRFVRIQLGALAAGLAQGIDDMGADTQKTQLENLKQSYGTRADNDRFNVLFRHVKPIP